MSGSYFPFLAKLKRINPGENVDNYVNNQMKQNLKAIEDALKKGYINFTEAQSAISALQNQGANFSISADINAFNTNSTTLVDVVSLNITLTTSNPVEIYLVPRNLTTSTHTVFDATGRDGLLNLQRNGINLCEISIGRDAGTGAIYDANIMWVDIPGPGTHTYTLQAECSIGASNFIINHGRLYAKEVR
jgi:hypothetical protein